ncbi:glycosyltransferase [Mycobacterium sp. SMC-2]|uniref:glycosyltransferase n=1 Tax=Mycobacterium sp. SMC-2 TaxID=2857058 RepID=UPI0021B3422C|nr:glycosyltransferase family 2 protein [Mycobacterium sp. SMC-2]UXA05059.1 glycosyltransferase [Mycobacterium sp. SMC-2]
MSQQPSVSIVIPAFNEEHFIGRCLQSCVRQTSPPDEIIVVNNRSTDATVSVVRRYQKEHPHLRIRLLHQNGHQGIAPTRNHGFDHARSDIIARTDADAMIADNWVETIRGRFADPAIDAASGPIALYDMPLPGFLFWLDRKLRLKHSREKNERFLLGANMAIRARAWQTVRHLTQLDVEDQLHEDVDLALTLFKNGFEIVYEPTMVAAMSGRRLESSLRDFYHYVTRYTRTTELHGIKSRTARTTVVTLMLLYFPFRAIRLFYDAGDFHLTLLRQSRADASSVELPKGA